MARTSRDVYDQRLTTIQCLWRKLKATREGCEEYEDLIRRIRKEADLVRRGTGLTSSSKVPPPLGSAPIEVGECRPSNRSNTNSAPGSRPEIPGTPQAMAAGPPPCPNCKSVKTIQTLARTEERMFFCSVCEHAWIVG